MQRNEQLKLSNRIETRKCCIKLFVLILFFAAIFFILSSQFPATFKRFVNHSDSFKLFIPRVNASGSKKAYWYIPEVTESAHADILLIYVYADTHKYAYGNLKYFIENAVREQDGVDYIFILQQVNNKVINESEMPPLPSKNAYYIQHENKCFDFGTIGWFFEKYTTGNPWISQTSINDNINIQHREKFNLARYKYFIFMNSSVRGPFLPPYFLKFLSDSKTDFNQSYYWYHIFTTRINNKIKLVGCTIGCTNKPHVQSYFVTTDFTGLSILLKSSETTGTVRSGVFGCYPSKSDTTEISEMGMSSQIIQSGYMIDCLLTKFQTIDFSAKANYQCNIVGNTYAGRNLDGVSIEPYEVVFVKFNDKQYTIEVEERAKLYQRWMEQVNITNRTSW